MSATDILNLVREVTGVKVNGRCVARKHSNARFVAILIMSEEGLTAHQIAAVIGNKANHVYAILRRINNVLLVKNERFKTAYLACIARMAELEGAA